MQLKDTIHESRAFLNRAIVAGLLVAIAALALIWRMVQLQITNHEHFTTLSRENRVKVVPLPPTRGLIYDRRDVLLAQNRPAYSLEITPEQVDDIDTLLKDLAQVIEINDDDLERFWQLKKRKRRFDSVPIRVNLSPDETAQFAVYRHRFPGVDIKAQLLRHYPYDVKTTHVLGYVGRVSQRDLEQIDASNYAGTSHIGKNGVERTYESALHGSVGYEQIEINAAGRRVRTLEQTPPEPGVDVHLHIDIALQEVAMRAFGDNNGAIVAINPQNGGVLAFVSQPGYDPNLFVEGISRKDYDALQENPDRPLYNRALRGQYPPGSTIKPFMGLAGLEYGTIQFDTSAYCPGYFQLPGNTHKYRDWKKSGHGSMDLDSAIVQSCDVFFYKLAYELGIDRLHDFLSQFGFGDRTGIDLTGESTGLLPSRQWKRRARNQPWYPGETLIMGIGQGYFLTTPLQLAAATAAIANNGTYYTPHVVDYLQSRATGEITPIPPTSQPIPKALQQNWDDVRKGMTNVVESPRGTAKRIRSSEYRIAGKTGTAQVFTVGQDEDYNEEEIDKKLRDHALFIAYAPVENPQIAIAVVVENGGHGGSAAAPIAREVMDAYLLNRDEPLEATQ
ncbi:MAG: penicillin-binding protein 2 [Chromatiaceae bacterium]|nr:penicillin-binding protein 2 [Gammaproteobacteria bacterium]MCP5301494.1 penicillin-binding protein 2 [Chromatiaceae bacterium]MCP5423058.1 penicillin-binding protein 2 [Chromatiaceae bacterium]